MRFSLPLALTCLLLILGLPVDARAQQPSPPPPRDRTIIDRDWRFVLGNPPSAADSNFNDRDWQAVNLPHSFSEPYFLSSDYYQGVGWYRKHLYIKPQATNKRVFLEFDGTFRASQIFLNGKPVGSHAGGYTGFSIDITDSIKPGTDNLLAVRLDNRWNARLAPRAGDHTFSGGIYRDVWLVITDPIHVTWYGTFIKTPDLTPASATVNIDTEVKNDFATDKRVTVQSDVINPAGETVATTRSTAQQIRPGQTATISQTTPAISNPALWSPQSPILYTIRTTIFDGDRAADTYLTLFGFRSIKFTPEQGFFLNGQHYYFKGADVHQDHAGWGDAVTQSGAARDVQLIKEAGFDFIRGSHYPHSPAFADACDRIGVLFWSENDFWGCGSSRSDGSYRTASAYPPKADDQPAFEQSVLDDLRDMIRVHCNHPSIIIWSTGNEDFFTAKSTLPNVRNLLAKEVALAHQLDPTRPVGIGGCQRGDLDKLGDVAGYNGDGARLFIDPGLPSVITEYGSTTSLRPGKYDPGWGDLVTTKGKSTTQPTAGDYPWRYPWRSGEAIWCGFDHGTHLGARFGEMGIIDYFRIPKRAWYWYRNNYRNIPPPTWPQAGIPARLQLTSDKSNIARADGTDDVHLLVTVLDAAGQPISNSPPVRLAVISGPGEFPTGPTIDFDENTDIPIRDGQAAIEFRSYYAGTTLIRATSPGLAPAEITLTSAGGPPFVPGQTSPVPARPYVRFTASSGNPADSQTVFGLNNPTFPSSEAPGHPGNFANDANPSTFWQAADGDSRPSWTVDLERGVSLSSIRITFPDSTVHHLKIEMSEDRTTWHPVANLTHDDATSVVREVPLPDGSKGRFVRVSFPDSSPSTARISEFEAHGKLLGS